MATQKITPCLWFDGNAEEAANFYVSIIPDSRVDAVQRAPGDYPSGKEGDALVVEFTLAGQRFTGLNGAARTSSSTKRSRSRSTAPTKPRSTG
jgi:predicted 3-demethylubiquinone-9 3-methyltransferase (glyoxalase superfamily)